MKTEKTSGLAPTLPETGWFITNGTTPVGPLEIGLILRGVEAGKVPIESFVRHETWKVWRPLAEMVPARPAQEAAPEPTDLAEGSKRGDQGPPSSGKAPSAALAKAEDLPGALLLLLGAAVQTSASDAGIVHEVRDESAVVAWAHGPNPAAVAGERAGLLDPAVLAAAAGAMVIAEPSPGPAGQAILGRLTKLGSAPHAAFMIPIRPRDRLFGMLEIGRKTAYRAGEIARVEALVDALVTRIETAGWA